jgi:surface antigen
MTHRIFSKLSARELFAVLLAGIVFVGAPTLAAAEPPPWAPAHGYRAKQGQAAHQQARYDHRDALPDVLSGGRCDRETIGKVLGGAAGAAAGSQIGSGRGQILATIGGAILGVLIGGEIGRTMDEADAACTGAALEHLPDGQSVAWNDPNGGAYSIRPTETTRRDDGAYCREYRASATVDGERKRTYGTACRQPDGSWKIVN